MQKKYQVYFFVCLIEYKKYINKSKIKGTCCAYVLTDAKKEIIVSFFRSVAEEALS